MAAEGEHAGSAGKAPPGRFFYRLAGWTLQSPRRLPYLAPAAAAKADISIAFRHLPEPEMPPAFSYGPYRVFSPALIRLVLPGGVRIEIRSGRRLTVDAPQGYGDAALHTILFGAAFAVLCHQRGCPPLHASAAVFGGAAVAIAGGRGAGKSTTVRALMQRGGHLLADDQLVISPGNALAAAGFPSMKLWRSATDWFGEPLDDAERAIPAADKYHVRTDVAFYGEWAPVKTIFCLTPEANLAAPQARRLPQAEAVVTLDRMVYRSEIATAFGSRPAIFAWALKLSALVPVYHLRRPAEFSQLAALTDLILEIAASHGLNLENVP